MNIGDKTRTALGIAAFIMIMGIVGRMDYEDALVEERGYCANVTLYYTSSGSAGWPDYEGYYSTVCAKYSDDPQLFFPG